MTEKEVAQSILDRLSPRLEPWEEAPCARALEEMGAERAQKRFFPIIGSLVPDTREVTRWVELESPIALSPRLVLYLAGRDRDEFEPEQLREIRLGAKDPRVGELGVTTYADPSYDWQQMREIREGVGYSAYRSLNIATYANPAVGAWEMGELREFLEDGVNPARYPVKGLDAPQLSQVRQAIRAGLDVDEVSAVANPKYSPTQMEQIRIGLELGLAISWYADPNLETYQMEQIRLGLENDVDVSWYAYPGVDFEQMEQLRYGLEDGLTDKDMETLSNLDFDGDQMEEIRLGLKAGLDVSVYADPDLPYDLMHELRRGLVYGVDVSPLATGDFGPSLIRSIVDADRAGAPVPRQGGPRR